MNITLHQLIEKAVEEFDQILPGDPGVANSFFEQFGVGNSKENENLPFERFTFYQNLLLSLSQSNYDKYQLLHKGTPFYYLAWLAFDCHNYEKGLFYIDAAISEDVRTRDTNWINLPAGNFLTLQANAQVASRTIVKVWEILNNELIRFNELSRRNAISVEKFISEFVKPFLVDPSKRTIISALYIFLLEYQEREIELQLRSVEGGSIAPFLHHLFSGAVIFESILKHLFPVHRSGDMYKTNKTIGDIFRSDEFKKTFPGVLTEVSAYSISEIVAGIVDDELNTSFVTTAKIRNTTGHNLVWDDQFRDPALYESLFQQQVNAILYTVSTCFMG